MIIPPIAGLGSELSLGASEALAHGGAPSGGSASGAPAASGDGFGGELTEAISSLEKSQDSASSASQALATGTVADPESAVVTVEDAQMAMDLAAQIRTKATEAAQTIFQTQV
jgi:flagellar hook-basal body complex protein FliE